jgi:hypothetical protein
MPTDKTSRVYIDAYNAEAARLAKQNAAYKARALDGHPNLANIAREVGRHLGRDQAHRQRILQRSPYVFAAMDATEVATASARELAARELKELGIDCGDNDPVQLLDAHHSGRQFARDQQIPGNRLVGGNKVAIPGNKLLGDHSMDSSGSSTLDKYLGIEK